MTVVIDGTAGITTPAIASTNESFTNSPVVATPTAGLVVGTAQNTTSGTSIDFTGIPSWAKRITLMLNGVSTNGIPAVILRVGSGSIQSSGYASNGTGFGGTAISSVNYTTSFGLEDIGSAAYLRNGAITLTLLGSNIWAMTSSYNRDASSAGAFGMGSVTLSGVLDRVRITTTNGTDTFDAGSVNIMYEG